MPERNAVIDCTICSSGEPCSPIETIVKSFRLKTNYLFFTNYDIVGRVVVYSIRVYTRIDWRTRFAATNNT